METTPNRRPGARAATVHVIDAEADLAEPDRTSNPTGFRRLAVYSPLTRRWHPERASAADDHIKATHRRSAGG
jgi:hypothetical protein